MHYILHFNNCQISVLNQKAIVHKATINVYVRTVPYVHKIKHFSKRSIINK